jgi:protein-disulfide isomerase
MANKNNAKKDQGTSSKFVFWVVGLIAIGVLGLIFLNSYSDDQKEQAETKTAEIDYSSQPFLGEESAPVSIVEFGDYKCPACKSFAESYVPLILDEFVDTGKAKFYFMNDSFINVDSERSAKFAESVFQELGNEKFWEFHDLLYKKQPEDAQYEKVDYFTEQFLTDVLNEVASAEQADKVVKNFRDKKSYEAWEKDMDYVEKLGVTGTPTLFVNGKKFTGQSMDDLKAMVDEAAKGK